MFAALLDVLWAAHPLPQAIHMQSVGMGACVDWGLVLTWSFYAESPRDIPPRARWWSARHLCAVPEGLVLFQPYPVSASSGAPMICPDVSTEKIVPPCSDPSLHTSLFHSAIECYLNQA